MTDMTIAMEEIRIDDLLILSIEEVEDFLHEFLTYSDEEKNQRYPGLQNVLFELMKVHT